VIENTTPAMVTMVEAVVARIRRAASASMAPNQGSSSLPIESRKASSRISPSASPRAPSIISVGTSQ
jgi:hypothetical protein